MFKNVTEKTKETIALWLPLMYLLLKHSKYFECAI